MWYENRVIMDENGANFVNFATFFVLNFRVSIGVFECSPAFFAIDQFSRRFTAIRRTSRDYCGFAVRLTPFCGALPLSLPPADSQYIRL